MVHDKKPQTAMEWAKYFEDEDFALLGYPKGKNKK